MDLWYRHGVRNGIVKKRLSECPTCRIGFEIQDRTEALLTLSYFMPTVSDSNRVLGKLATGAVRISMCSIRGARGVNISRSVY